MRAAKAVRQNGIPLSCWRGIRVCILVLPIRTLGARMGATPLPLVRQMTDRLISTTPTRPEALPLLEGLVTEYDVRYGDLAGRGSSRDEIDRYPAVAFLPPLGDFLVLQQDGQTVAGGAFMPHDDETAEIKRVWTAPDQRRRGLSRRIMVALERRAGELGYTRLYLTTGFRQPEAVALYLSLGYRPLFDPTRDPALYRSLPFEKHIGAQAGRAGTAPLRQPVTSFEAATAEVKAIKSRHEAWLTRRLASFTATG